MNLNLISIKEPQTVNEFEAYYLLRYQLLRAPWNQPKGSEKDNMEDDSIHAIALDNDQTIIGVCRLQFNSKEESQIRYMAVADSHQGKGIGKKLVKYMENRAKQQGIQTMILHARENALPFYKKCGYTIIEKNYLMWGEIQHYLMGKKL